MMCRENNQLYNGDNPLCMYIICIELENYGNAVGYDLCIKVNNIYIQLKMAARKGTKSAQTSTGQTRGISVAPTRDLATQISAVIEPLARA